MPRIRTGSFRPRTRARNSGTSRVGGFTLVEAIVALVVLAAAVAGVLLVFIGPMTGSADPMIRAQARAIAAAYMDEIVLHRYGTGPGDCGGGPREDYDTIWCYAGLDEDPTNQYGDPIASLSDYAVLVQVTGDAATATITVDVDHVSQRVDYRLEGRRASY